MAGSADERAAYDDRQARATVGGTIRRVRRIPALLLVLAIAPACAGGPDSQPAVAPLAPSFPVRTHAPPVPPPAPFRTSLVAGTSVEGRPIDAFVRGAGQDVVLVFAAIHGEEPAGVLLVRSLLDHLEAHPELVRSRRVVLVPVVNPDGLAAGRRVNASGVDLNRNFPAPNWRDGGARGPRALSEPEALALDGLLRVYRPDRVVSIHQPLACVDWDGPARRLAAAMADASGLPARKLGTRPGSFGAYAEANDLALVTLELPKGVERLPEKELWKRYGAAILTAVTWPLPPPAASPGVP
jgi:protein MpaA